MKIVRLADYLFKLHICTGIFTFFLKKMQTKLCYQENVHNQVPEKNSIRLIVRLAINNIPCPFDKVATSQLSKAFSLTCCLLRLARLLSIWLLFQSVRAEPAPSFSAVGELGTSLSENTRK